MVIPPIVLLAQETFYRDLPQLLQERPGQWVAYHGDKQVGFSKDKSELYLDCQRRGMSDFVVYGIVPQSDVMYLSFP